MYIADLELIHENIHDVAKPVRPVFLVCVFRDECLLLDYFLKYYRAIGVTDFIFIDNLSEDQGVEFIKNIKGVNIKLFSAKGSYKDSEYGTSWVNYVLKKYCRNQYCFTVDIDELFYFDRLYAQNLHELIDKMEALKANVVPAMLLDMYPEETNNDYKKGDDFLKHSKYFDKYNDDFYEKGQLIYKKFYHKKGGVRKRVFDTTVCIHKFPFFKYDFYPVCMAAGYHFFQNDKVILFNSEYISLLQRQAIVLHFKFIKPNIQKFFKKRVELNEDWDNSVEYKSYVDSISVKNKITFFDARLSKSIDCKNSLESLFNYY